MHVGICGGGNLAHAMAAWLGCHGHKVSIVTRRPTDWASELRATLPDGSGATAPLASVSTDYGTLGDCEIILLTAPRFAIPSMCNQVRPHIHAGQLLAIAPGTPELLSMRGDPAWRHVELMGIYKVPFICRADVYGHRVSILGSRAVNRAWVSGNTDWGTRSSQVAALFDTPLERLGSPYPFLLTNSNPLLHPARLSTMFADYREGVCYDHNILFYEEWTEAASERYIQADAELLEICRRIPEMRIGTDIVPVLEYYESHDAASLTAKIRSIPAFKGITSPMVQTAGGWIPDFSSRYFTEDIPWGTALICELARKLNVPTPTLDAFVQWNDTMLWRFGQPSPRPCLQYSQYCRHTYSPNELTSGKRAKHAKAGWKRSPYKGDLISTSYMQSIPYSIGNTVGESLCA